MTKKKMTEKQLANLKSIKKGEVRNPIGANAHKGPASMFKKLTKEMFVEMINAATTGTVADLKKIAEGSNSTALQVALSTCLIKIINKGDYDQLERMLQRVIGKVPDELDVTSGGKPIAPAAQLNVYLPANGRTREENNK